MKDNHETDFFEADTVYVNGENPFRAPELTPEFWCKLVTVHPTLGTKWAVGWPRNGHLDEWGYGLVAYQQDQWVEGKWVPSPWKNKTGTGE